VEHQAAPSIFLTLQESALGHAMGRIDSQDGNRRPAHGSSTDENWTIPAKMTPPFSDA